MMSCFCVEIEHVSCNLCHGDAAEGSLSTEGFHKPSIDMCPSRDGLSDQFVISMLFFLLVLDGLCWATSLQELPSSIVLEPQLTKAT